MVLLYAKKELQKCSSRFLLWKNIFAALFCIQQHHNCHAPKKNFFILNNADVLFFNNADVDSESNFSPQKNNKNKS